MGVLRGWEGHCTGSLSSEMSLPATLGFSSHHTEVAPWGWGQPPCRQQQHTRDMLLPGISQHTFPILSWEIGGSERATVCPGYSLHVVTRTRELALPWGWLGHPFCLQAGGRDRSVGVVRGPSRPPGVLAPFFLRTNRGQLPPITPTDVGQAWG